VVETMLNKLQINGLVVLLISVFYGSNFELNADAQRVSSCSKNKSTGETEVAFRTFECKNSGLHLMASNLYQASPEIQDLLNKAEAAIQENRDNDAIIFWTKALELDPNIPEALLRRGSTYLLQRNFDKGLADFRQLESFYKSQGNSSYADIATQLIKDTQAAIASGEINEE
jgi:tetratricopeptide (TPR) repeat protein